MRNIRKNDTNQLKNMQGYKLMSTEYLAGLFNAYGCASSYVQRKKKTNKTVQVHSCEISMTNK